MVKPQLLPERGPLKRYAEAINKLGEALQSLRISRGIGYNVQHTSYGQVLKIDVKKAVEQVEQSDKMQYFQVVEIFPDYLLCVKLGSTDDPKFSVAKPLELRVSTQTNVTLNWADADEYIVSFRNVVEKKWNWRRLTSVTTSKYFDEYLNPPYNPAIFGATRNIGSVILAFKTDTGVVDNDGNQCEWVDINIDSRHYKQTPYLTAVCVNTSTGAQTRYLYLSGGPPQP